jgi:hypothetical protein
MARASRSRSAQDRARRSTDKPVLLELTAAQVGQVLHHASSSGSLSLLLSGLPKIERILQEAPWRLEDERYSRSLLLGLLILAVFPVDRSYAGNVDIARALDINISTTHRYLSTLVSVGLLERHPTTRKYRLADGG